MIDRLRRLLDGMGYELGAPELLDVLWLARAMDDGRTTTAAAAPGAAAPAAADDPAGPERPAPGAAAPAPPGASDETPAARPDQPRADDAPAEDTDRRHSLFTAHDASGGSSDAAARAVRAPGPRALPGLHGLARALRPLRAHRDHRHLRAADIEATVRLTAESGVPDIVDRPEQELRHTAVLLVDDSPSMRVWRPLVREVRRLLERGGVFRAVHVHRFDLRAGHRPGTTPRTESPVVFLLTDGVDEAWHGPAARRLLRTWERSGPLVVVPPLPRRLWRGTAFDARPQLLTAAHRFAANGGLAVTDPLAGAPVDRSGDPLPLPVVPLAPASLGTWARLLTRPGAPQLLDTVLVGDDGPPGEGAVRRPAGAPQPSAEERVERFRASFSPDAYRLAVRLSAIRPLSLPVIQLLRAATLPTGSSAVVAEVLLGDLLTPLPENAWPGGLPVSVLGGEGEIRYDFQPGVRDLLASGLGTERSLEVVEAVGRALEPYLGRMPDFAALLADPGGAARLSPGTTAFAVLVSPVLDRLYGGPQGGPVPPGDTAPGPLRFTVFGPSLARRGGGPVHVGSPRQQAVLAALLLAEHRMVTSLALVDAVWGDQAPESGEHAVREHIVELGRILAPAGFVIEEQSGSYRLRAEPAGAAVPLDLTEAGRLHLDAKEAYGSRDLVTARRLLVEALSLLHGPPLEGVPGPYAESQRARLREWRLALVESRIELDLGRGAHADLVPELIELTEAHPLRERLRAQLMVALYRSGRTAEALEAYEHARRLLAEELGTDPHHELRALADLIRAGRHPDLVRTGHPALPPPPTAPAAPSWPPSAGIRFAVLGPVQAWRDTDPLPVRSPQQRAFLAALLLRDGRTATASELIDAIWGEEPPSQALAAVRTYASRLRKVLDPGILVSDAGGYAVRVAPDALDLHVVRRLEAASETAHREGHLPRALDLLSQALGIWEGEPLASVPGPYAQTQRTRLEEWRLGLLERRLDFDLALGGHAEAVAELTALTAAHPLRERLRELLMLALYRSGRQAEALAVYADTRRILADELGVTPRPELSRLQQRILQADAELLDYERGFESDEPPPLRPPAMLPASVPDFTGRNELGHELTGRLLEAAAGQGDPASVVTVLTGVGGVGKTTFAVRLAHEVRQRFVDGQIFVDLQGHDRRATAPEVVLGSLLRTLGLRDSEIAATLGERAAQFRAALDGRRVLLVLDNARDAAQVRPLLPGTAGCAVLVTSRSRLVGLEGARVVDLDVLSPAEALQLFARIVGEERVESDREAALDVVAACGFLPLAIRIAASRLAARRAWSVSVLAAKLADERRRLDELRAGDLDVKATFELGYGQLEPAQARAFRLLALADGPDVSLAAAAAVLDLPAHDAEDLLESLVDASLLESAAPGRYRYLPLVRLFARACAERDELPGSERESALSRLLDFYLTTACRVYAIERPGDRLVDHLELTGREGLAFTDYHDALDWLHGEAGCLLGCARQSAVPARLRRGVDLLWVIRDLCESGPHSLEYESTARVLFSAAESLGDLRTIDRISLITADALATLGRFDEAARLGDRTLRQASSAQDPLVVGRAANARGMIALHQNRAEDAEAYLDRALGAFRADGDRSGEASALCNLALARLTAGDPAAALSLVERAVAVYDDMGLLLRGADARYVQGRALTAVGRYEEAKEALNEAREVFGDHRQLLWEGMALFRLAETELAAGRPTRSAALAEAALGHIDRSGSSWRRGNVLAVLGRALDALGQRDRARTCRQEALAVFEELGAPEAEEMRALLG